jgi:hypothetical protein
MRIIATIKPSIMKKYFILSLLLSSLSTLIAQTAYEKGFYIDNAGSRIDGYIKNADWKDNPDSFEFSTTLTAENPITKTIKEVQAFEITGITLFERHRVNIDRAPQDVNNLGYQRNPEMKEETLFLRVLLNGENKLYRYGSNSALKFYFKKGGNPINALVYKRYLSVSQDIAENNYYQQQLLNNFKCESGKLPRMSNVNYTTSDLLNFFQKYNQCTGIETQIVDQRELGTTFQITAVLGMNSNSYLVNPGNRISLDFGSSITPVFGIELEYILPIYNKSWSIFLDTRYSSFEGELTIPVASVFSTPLPDQNVTLDYSSIDIAPGFRHYFFLSKSLKIFVNLSYALEISSDTTLDYERTEDILSEISAGNIGVGVGFTFKDLRFEARYNGNKNHFGKSIGRGPSDYKSFMLTLGYSFVKC